MTDSYTSKTMSSCDLDWQQTAPKLGHAQLWACPYLRSPYSIPLSPHQWLLNDLAGCLRMTCMHAAQCSMSERFFTNFSCNVWKIEIETNIEVRRFAHRKQKIVRLSCIMKSLFSTRGLRPQHRWASLVQCMRQVYLNSVAIDNDKLEVAQTNWKIMIYLHLDISQDGHLL